MTTQYRKIVWTEHSKIKMRQYGLSKQKILGILHKPERSEQGIVPGTMAMMRTNRVSAWKPDKSPKGHFDGPVTISPKASLVWKPKRAPGEIWFMYKDVNKVKEGQIRKIISAWRYPGITKPGEAIPIPADIRFELENNDEYK